MCRTNHHVAVAITLQKTPPRGSREDRVKIGAHDPPWFQALHGAVDAISGNDRLGALRRQVNTDMPWGVAWCGLQPHLVIERKVVAYKLCLVRFDHRHDAIDEMGLRVLPV